MTAICKGEQLVTSAVSYSGYYYASRFSAAFSSNIKDKDTLTKYTLRLHELVIKYETGSNARLPIKPLCNCTKIQFVRNVLMDANFYLSRQSIRDILSKCIIKEVSYDV